jgi:hypothetical protein
MARVQIRFDHPCRDSTMPALKKEKGIFRGKQWWWNRK